MRVNEHIIKEIHENGPVTFRDFMDMALYDRHGGYYTSGKTNIGQHGDYYTSPLLTPVFGMLIGKQIEEMWYLTGAGPFTIVEYGAGKGQLCLDILDYLKNNRKLYRNLEYVIIEKDGGSFAKSNFPEIVSQKKELVSLSGFTGCILSNEMLDNFPVHRITMQDQLMEICVNYFDGFAEYLVPAGKKLRDYFHKWDIRLPRGYHTEINLDAENWIREIASSLGKGYIITIDYGYSAGELYNSKRCNGTLTCYSHHHRSSDPYRDIGKKDITSHVNFTALSDWGRQYGLETCGLVNQADFLLSLGFKQTFIRKHSDSLNISEMAFLQSLLNRILLLEMGTTFKVLIQKKGNVSRILTGLNK